MKRQVLPWSGIPAEPQVAHDVHWQDQVRGLLTSVSGQSGLVLPFGMGRSYGDVCCADGNHVIAAAGLDRIMSFDKARGVIRAEAGLSLGALLAIVLPLGWFLPVTPGTTFVTLGGAVANDVHGKNHHRRGTFGRHVTAFGLVRSDRDAIVCAADQNPELFAATIGGLGLTGFITWVEIQLMPVTSSRMEVVTQRFGSLSEFFSLSAELDAQHEYGVAWVDCLASGAALGRGVYGAAQHSPDGGCQTRPSLRLSVPFNTRLSMVNGLTSRVVTTAKWQLAPRLRRNSVERLERFFYPLDGLHHWNRLYGRQGFQQFQCVVPEVSAREGIAELLSSIARSGLASFLTVLKRCGDVASPGLLSFPMAGTSLAIDFPQSRDLGERLLPRLDAIVREAKGRLYPAKDAHMRGEDFRHAYPAWTKVESLRDPAIRSRFWTRVTT